MRIKTLEIYGFGRLEQRKYNLDRPFTQIFGENETGKSTMQRFIHSILFGFPDKDEPKLLPRFAEQYGGNMVFTLQDHEVFVERVMTRGKAHVTVKRDGDLKDEAWLKQALNFMTKETYESIFSFDVLGLQQVHRLTEDKLQDYLLQAGVFGSREFSGLEDKLSDEKEQLLTDTRASGKLYEHLLELQRLETLIQLEEEKLSHYDQLDSKHYQLTGTTAQLKAHVKQLEEIQERKQKELMYHADMKEWKGLEHKLNIPPLSFPDQGIERYESLKHGIQSLLRDIAIRQEKVEQLKQEVAHITLMEDDRFEQLSSLTLQEGGIKQHDKSKLRLEREVEAKAHEIAALSADIGWQQVHTVDLNEALKRDIMHVVADKERLTVKEEQLQREVQAAEQSQMLAANKMTQISRDIVSDDDYEKGVKLSETKSELSKKSELYDKLSAEQDRLAQDELRKQKQLNIIYSIGFMAGVIMAGYFFYSGQMLAGALSLLVPVIMVALIVMNKPVTGRQKEIMTAEIEQLEIQILELTNALDDTFDLKTQGKLREERLVYELEHSSTERTLKALQNELAEVSDKLRACNQKLSTIKSRLRLGEQFEDSLLHHAYKTIKTLQLSKETHDKLQAEYDKEQQALTHFEQQVTAFDASLSGMRIPEMCQRLQEKMKFEQNNRVAYKRASEQLQLGLKEAESVELSLKEMQQEVAQLKSEASAEDESSYYKAHRDYTQYTQDLERFNQLSKRLEEENFTYEVNSELAHTSNADLRNQEVQILEQLQHLRDELQEGQYQLKQLDAQLTDFENDTQLSDLNYQYEIERNIFNDLAKDYSALEYIDLLINAHRRTVKEERIPFIISAASTIFKTLTEGRYKKVIYDQELRVKHKDGQIYHPTELSQSTKELLYIAMRLSLIEHLSHIYPMPLIIDDAFVHFDKHRKDFIIEYLFNNAKNQILYFTCNRTMNITGKNTLVLERHEKESKV